MLKNGTVTDCTFINNTAKYGGAIYFHSGCAATNCTFINNTAALNGGAIYCDSYCSINYCAFDNNHAESKASVIYNIGFEIKSIENNWWGSNNPNW